MTIALVAAASQAAASFNQAAVTSGAINTTGANLLVGIANSLNFSNNHFSDSAGNTWTAGTVYHDAGTTVVTQLYYCLNPTTSATHTFTNNTNSNACYPSMAVAAFSGVATSGAFKGQSGNGVTSVTTAQPGSLTTDVNNSLLVFGGTTTGTITAMTTSPGTVASAANGVGGTCIGSVIAYSVLGTAGAFNPTLTAAGSGNIAVAMMNFDPPAAGAAASSGFFFSA